MDYFNWMLIGIASVLFSVVAFFWLWMTPQYSAEKMNGPKDIPALQSDVIIENNIAYPPFTILLKN